MATFQVCQPTGWTGLVVGWAVVRSLADFVVAGPSDWDYIGATWPHRVSWFVTMAFRYVDVRLVLISIRRTLLASCAGAWWECRSRPSSLEQWQRKWRCCDRVLAGWPTRQAWHPPSASVAATAAPAHLCPLVVAVARLVAWLYVTECQQTSVPCWAA